MAAKYWLGRGVAIAHKDTITMANTFAATDTVTVTINGKDLTVTLGTDVTTTQVATAVKEMINGDTQTGTGDHTFSTTGNLVGEFARLTATSSGAVVTVTADDAGVPFTMTATESTAGTGTATRASSVANAGPHVLTTVDNWSGDAVPVDGDDLIFDGGSSSDVLYDLGGLAIQPASVTITSDFTGKIGLPKTNVDDPNLPYDEYREDQLTFANDTGTAATTVNIGDGTGQGSQRIKIDFADCDTVTANIYGNSSRLETGTPVILLNGTVSTNILNVYRGDVGWSFYEGDTGHLATIRVGYIDNQAGDAAVVIGNDCDLGDATITMSGGVLTTNSANGTGSVTIFGGEFTPRSGAHAAITVDEGTCFYRSTGTLTTLAIGGGGTADFRRDNSGRTVTNASINAGGTYLDPFKTVTLSNGLDFNRCSVADCTVDFGPHVTLTPSTI